MNEESLFYLAQQQPDAAARDAFLDAACGDQPQLRARLDKLLQAHDAPVSLFDKPAVEMGTTLDAAASPSSDSGTGEDSSFSFAPLAEVPGMRIGPYKLLQKIGEGGMGDVWMAEQEQPVRRNVALKIIKPGLDSRQVIARFEVERQALALMDHVNIAHVLDGGATESGRPFFVMELIHGIPITKYCDDYQLTPRERMELFVPVCQAIQHAHQKGVIHRDIKPSNVLVARYDGKAVPKVIDFGVAKAVEQRLTERTLFTQCGSIIGTFEYMSPEQAEMSAQGIDTRSDIYSLGVLLYELLTSTTPLQRQRVRSASYTEIVRMIREEEPAKPSTRLNHSETLPAVAAARRMEPVKLAKLVHGELDWIVMKALEKDRNRRYETASAFAADVQHYLHDEPVLACPPSRWYRFGKFARRNKRTLATAALLGVMLFVATGAVVVSAVWAAYQAEARAQLEADHKDKLEDALYISHIALAERELAAGNVGRAEALLDECPEYLRGWEWYFLKRQRYGNAPPLPHSITVVRVDFSPDGCQIASVCMDGTIIIRDARTGQVLHALERPTVPFGDALVRGIAYSLDSRYLAVARNDGLIRVWEASSGHLVHTLEGHKGPAWQVAFSADSRTLVSGGSDRSVRLWDVSRGQELQVFRGHPSPVKGVAFRSDGRCVVAACDDGTVKVWDRDTGRETFSFRGELLAYPWAPWFSADARRLAWSCLDGVVKIWDTTTGQLEIDQQSNTHQCRAVAFSPDGRRIALAGFDGTLRLLDAVTGRGMLTIFAHKSLVAGVAFSPDGNKLASASYDHTVRIWDATPLDGDPQAPHCVTLTGHTDKVSAVAFSSDGRWLGSASWDHTVKLWEFPSNGGTRVSAPTGQSPAPASGGITLRCTLRGHRSIVTGLAFSCDKRTLASASWDNTFKLWDLQTPRGDSLTETLSIPLTRRVQSIAFSPDGQLLAIGQDNGIALYDPAAGKPVHPFKGTPAAVPSVAFHPYRPLLISTGASDPAVKAWSVAAERFSFEIRHNSSPNPCVAVSPDGRRIASPLPDQRTGDHIVKVWNVDWDAKTYKESRTLKGHRNYVWKVAFSPDGRYLASGSWDSTIKVWDLEAADSAEPVTLRGHAGFILGLAFSPDGRRLASGSGYAGYGEIKVWDAALWENKANEGGR